MKHLGRFQTCCWVAFLTLLGCDSSLTPPSTTQNVESAQKIEIHQSLDLALTATLKARQPLSYYEIAFMMNLPNEKNVGYALCLEAGAAGTCRPALGASHFEFGLCVSAGVSVEDCEELLNAPAGRLGYALCLIGGREVRDCNDALSAKGSQMGFGLCMYAGREIRDCNDALPIESASVGLGICMASARDFRDCNDALEATTSEVTNAPENLGFGLCMAGARDFRDCNDALGAENVAFGLCMAAGKDVSDCRPTLQ